MYYNVLQSTTKYYKILQSGTKYYKVLQSTAKHYKYYKVLQRITKYYKVLRHTLIRMTYIAVLNTSRISFLRNIRPQWHIEQSCMWRWWWGRMPQSLVCCGTGLMRKVYIAHLSRALKAGKNGWPQGAEQYKLKYKELPWTCKRIVCVFACVRNVLLSRAALFQTQ